jgi:hypothetical protein
MIVRNPLTTEVTESIEEDHEFLFIEGFSISSVFSGFSVVKNLV